MKNIYNEYKQLLLGARLCPSIGLKAVKWANNLYWHLDGDDVVLRHHRTHIVKIRQSGDVELNTNGWRSATTKKHINNFLLSNELGHLYQRNFIWYIEFGNITTKFVDGMVLERA